MNKFLAAAALLLVALPAQAQMTRPPKDFPRPNDPAPPSQVAPGVGRVVQVEMNGGWLKGVTYRYHRPTNSWQARLQGSITLSGKSGPSDTMKVFAPGSAIIFTVTGGDALLTQQVQTCLSGLEQEDRFRILDKRNVETMRKVGLQPGELSRGPTRFVLEGIGPQDVLIRPGEVEIPVNQAPTFSCGRSE